MAKCATVIAIFNILSCPKDHILEVDSSAKTLLVFFEYRTINCEKGLGALPELHFLCFVLTTLQAVAPAFEFTKERTKQLGEGIDLLQFDDAIIDRKRVTELACDVWIKLLG